MSEVESRIISPTPAGMIYPSPEGLTPLLELHEFATAYWGQQFDFEVSGKPRWWHVSEVGGLAIGGECGRAVTNGTEYFCLDEKIVGVWQIDIAHDGSVFGNTKFYRSTETGRLKAGERIVFY